MCVGSLTTTFQRQRQEAVKRQAEALAEQRRLMRQDVASWNIPLASDSEEEGKKKDGKRGRKKKGKLNMDDVGGRVVSGDEDEDGEVVLRSKPVGDSMQGLVVILLTCSASSLPHSGRRRESWKAEVRERKRRKTMLFGSPSGRENSTSPRSL